MSRHTLSLMLCMALAACAPGTDTPRTDTAATPAADAAPSPDPASTPGLTDYRWQLSASLDASGQPAGGPLSTLERPLDIEFGADTLSSSGACNRFHGGYAVQDGQLRVDALAQTERACLGTLMEADALLSAFLQGQPHVALTAGSPPTLELVASDGRRLLFKGEQTPEARYGGSGTRMFMEVAAQRESCPHPLIPDMQCLMVREVRYDDAGRQTRVSEDWSPLYQEIEGYEHTEGVRNVLRLKRFDIANPPADASSVAYVLDMVVESETARGGD